MKELKFSTIIKAFSLISGFATLVLFWCNGFSAADTLGSCAVTALTFFCHFALRLLIGTIVPNRFDHRAKWFRVGPREQKIYQKLKIKHWKRHIPTYDPRAFSLKCNTAEQIVSNMCRAEVVHEIIAVCSFLPLLLCLFFGEFWVFFGTSLAAALVDFVFVALQRSNRPRMVRLLEKQRRQ